MITITITGNSMQEILTQIGAGLPKIELPTMPDEPTPKEAAEVALANAEITAPKKSKKSKKEAPAPEVKDEVAPEVKEELPVPEVVEAPAPEAPAPEVKVETPAPEVKEEAADEDLQALAKAKALAIKEKISVGALRLILSQFNSASKFSQVPPEDYPEFIRLCEKRLAEGK